VILGMNIMLLEISAVPIWTSRQLVRREWERFYSRWTCGPKFRM